MLGVKRALKIHSLYDKIEFHLLTLVHYISYCESAMKTAFIHLTWFQYLLMYSNPELFWLTYVMHFESCTIHFLLLMV